MHSLMVSSEGWSGGGCGKWEKGGSFESRRRGEYEDACLCGARLGFRLLPLGLLYRTGRQPGPRWSAGERRGRYFLRWSPYSFDCFDGSGFSSSRPCNGRLVRSDIFRFVGDTFSNFEILKWDHSPCAGSYSDVLRIFSCDFGCVRFDDITRSMMAVKAKRCLVRGTSWI